MKESGLDRCSHKDCSGSPSKEEGTGPLTPPYACNMKWAAPGKGAELWLRLFSSAEHTAAGGINASVWKGLGLDYALKDLLQSVTAM